MITLINRAPRVRGEVDVFRWLPLHLPMVFPELSEDRKGFHPATLIGHGHNVVLNSGADIMAKAVAGDMIINGMYFGYDNAGSPYTDPTPPVERTASFYHSTGGGGTMNFVRVPTLAKASYAATDPRYNNNKVQFIAITDGVGVLPGTDNVLTDGTSQFYGAALAWLDPNNYENDILFSAVSFADLGSAHFVKIANAQLGIRWSLIFDVALPPPD